LPRAAVVLHAAIVQPRRCRDGDRENQRDAGVQSTVTATGPAERPLIVAHTIDEVLGTVAEQVSEGPGAVASHAFDAAGQCTPKEMYRFASPRDDDAVNVLPGAA